MSTEFSLENNNKKEILPFAPKNLWLLFFQPKKFFLYSYLSSRSIMFAAYIIGMFSVMDRVDQNLLKAEFSNRQSFMLDVADAWWSYWLLVLGVQSLSVFVWLIHGWWYKKRLQFSGVKDADPQLARHVGHCSH
jgi:hypothetical protein